MGLSISTVCNYCRIIGVGVVLITAGCANKNAAPKGGPGPALVKSAVLEDKPLVVRWTLMGEVEAEARAQMSAGADGELRRVLVKEGDRVKKGQLLANVDPSVARATMQASEALREQAQVQSKQAVRDAERFKEAGSKLVTGLEIERATSQAKALQAQGAGLVAEADRARAELSRHRLIAPFDGVVTQRLADPGDWVQQGAVLLEVVSQKPPEIFVRANAELLNYVEPGKSAVLRRGDNEVQASVRGVVRALDRNTRTITLRLSPDDDAPWLLAGSTVDAIVEASIREPGTIVIPRDALVMGAVNQRVFQLLQDKVEAVVVEVVHRSDEELLVRAAALKVGDKVIVRGNERLVPGQRVKEVQ